jgi:hypothetical protein
VLGPTGGDEEIGRAGAGVGDGLSVLEILRRGISGVREDLMKVTPNSDCTPNVTVDSRRGS